MPRPQTLIQRWPQADEKVTAATALQVDDGSEAWWAGVQLCGAAVPLAGAVLSLGVTTAILGTFEFNDDRPTPAVALQVDEVYNWQPPPIQPPPIALKAWPEDERVVPSTFTPSDEDSPQIGAVLADATYILWATDDPFATTFVAVEWDWQQPAIAPPAPIAQVWEDTDDIKPVLAPDDEWQAAPLPPPAPAFAALKWFDDAALVAVAAPVDEDFWQPLVVQPAGTVAPALWLDAGDIAQQAPAAVPEEDLWHRLYWVPVEPVLRIWTQQDETVTAPASLQVDEVHWQPPVFAWAPAQQPETADDEVVPQLRVDEVYWQAPAITPPPLAPAPLAIGDEIVPQPTPHPEEDYWLRLFTVTVYPSLWLATHQDEVTTAPPPAVFTADSRQRVGVHGEHASLQRIGNANETAAPQRIGGTTGAASSWRIGGKRQ